MKKILAVLCLLALLGGISTACGASKPGALLAGKWNADLASFEFKAFEFVPGEDGPGKGTVNLGMLSNLVKGSYEVLPAESKDAKDMVKITYTLWMISTTRSYYFTVDGNTLTLQEESSGFTTTYTREGAAAAGTTG